jgi:hypothetical protein
MQLLDEDIMGAIAWGIAIVVFLAFSLFVGWLILRILYRAAYPPKLARCPHCGRDLG